MKRGTRAALAELLPRVTKSWRLQPQSRFAAFVGGLSPVTRCTCQGLQCLCTAADHSSPCRAARGIQLGGCRNLKFSSMETLQGSCSITAGPTREAEGGVRSQPSLVSDPSPVQSSVFWGLRHPQRSRSAVPRWPRVGKELSIG